MNNQGGIVRSINYKGSDKNMKLKLAKLTVFFAAVLLIITGCFFFTNQKQEKEMEKEEQIIATNEIEKLIEMGEYEQASLKTAELQRQIRGDDKIRNTNHQIFWLCGICLVFLFIVFGFVYVSILRPFDKLQNFSEKIAQGNFDVPLNYERTNYFGQFTWAFDCMRQEITKARSCEREAIENNKTVIATLSHDIKTPIASIRAYAEGLEANLDSTLERREKYLRVLMRKCDEVSKLTNDLFLHSLSDLDKLKINLEEFEIVECVQEAVEEMAAEQGDLIFEKPGFQMMVQADKNRLVQIMENLINNGRKYAKSKIVISLVAKNELVEIHVRDYGAGILDEDMPFIFDKFYRGKNCGNEQGSGLGLYIVKYIAEQMGGTVQLVNHEAGLEVVVGVNGIH